VIAVLLALFAAFLIAMAVLVSFPASPSPTLIMQQSLLDHLAPPTG